MNIISLIVAGLTSVVCFSAAVSFGDAAENAQSPNHIENEDFPKADLNGDGVVDTTIVVSVHIFLKSNGRVLVLENLNADK